MFECDKEPLHEIEGCCRKKFSIEEIILKLDRTLLHKI